MYSTTHEQDMLNIEILYICKLLSILKTVLYTQTHRNNLFEITVFLIHSRQR